MNQAHIICLDRSDWGIDLWRSTIAQVGDLAGVKACQSPVNLGSHRIAHGIRPGKFLGRPPLKKFQFCFGHLVPPPLLRTNHV